MIEEKLKEILSYDLPSAPKPLASYVPAQKVGNLVFTSGQLPFKDGKLITEGKVGSDVNEELAIECARQCAVNCLSAIKSIVGNLDKVELVVKLVVFIASAAGFNQQPKIANGASDFMKLVFGDAGNHTRSAVGVCELPINAPVEIEMIVKIKE